MRTATGTASAPRGAETPLLGATLGRYRIDRVLGSGAMGVVYAAFDPDLERWIALKILPETATARAASERLLREARAMARLVHPNVTTVHEVGTSDGHDFVAMEMVEGETLADWLRASRPSTASVLEAFIAAGSGLAAAHAAGIVHRDFKPHNVLRHRDGRIVVTDFGLARDAEDALPPAPDADADAESDSVSLTNTGALLGTPAYMAPEQWDCAAVTPACDQFAYCVALWEALAGERPFRGATLDELRQRIRRGPAGLDASRIPRRMRSALRRGLDPDPARRWPDMKTLLARLAGKRRRIRVAIALASVLELIALAIVALAPLRSAQRAEICDPPARDVSAVWSLEIAARLRDATSDAHAAALEWATWRWRVARTGACQAAIPVRRAQLDCLDEVLDRFDTLRQAVLSAPDVAAEELTAQLVDPAICRKAKPSEIPRLTLTATPQIVAALALEIRSHAQAPPSEAELRGALDAAPNDPCARAIDALAVVERSHDERVVALDDMKLAATGCGDERLLADVAIAAIPYFRETAGMRHITDAVRNAQVAVARVEQSDVTAALAINRFDLERQEHHWDEALRLTDEAVASYASSYLPLRMLRAVVARNAMRLVRAEPDDLDAVETDAQRWREVARARGHDEIARQLDIQAAVARFRRGCVKAVHDRLIALWQHQPPDAPPVRARRITGTVVDGRGRPVVGAEVAAGGFVTADTVGIGLPTGLFDESLRDMYHLRLTRSDAEGRFMLDVADGGGVIVAQLGDQRSPPRRIKDGVLLPLAPTRTITGKVALDGVSSTRVTIYAALDGDPTHRFKLVAPPAADGAFTLAGAPYGSFRIGAAIRGNDDEISRIQFRAVPAASAPVTVDLDVARTARTVDVLIHNNGATALDSATVVMLGGRRRVAKVSDIVAGRLTAWQSGPATDAARQRLTPALRARCQRGDLVAHLDNVGPGEWTVCASSVAIDLPDPTSLVPWLDGHQDPPLVCERLGAADTAVVLEISARLRIAPTPHPQPHA